MDVLVTWRDGTQNIVSTKDLTRVKKGQKFVVGARVKMLYESKWYYGVISAVIDDAKFSSDDEPLSSLVEKNKNAPINVSLSIPPSPSPSPTVETPIPIQTAANEEYIQTCEFVACLNEVFSSCHRCLCLLCWEHFQQDTTSCVEHLNGADNNISHSMMPFLPVESPIAVQPNVNNYIQTCEFVACSNEVFSTCFLCSCLLCYEHFEQETTTSCSHHQRSFVSITHHEELPILSTELVPEHYEVEGEPREAPRENRVRVNKFKIAKKLRQEGKEYTSPYTKKVVAKREMGSLCNIDNCKKNGRNCHQFLSENLRENIFLDYYAVGNLTLQREYIVRYTEKKPVKQRTVATVSRRQYSHNFYLPLAGNKVKVCRKLFLNTLSISEKTFRTALSKVKSTGVLENEKRGGRKEKYVDHDKLVRDRIELHINRFPRVESHYCRQNTSREYLHEDLSIKKMHSMFLNEYNEQPSLSLYRNVFNSMNLSFHKPKKDQCSLCNTYRQGSEDIKNNLNDQYVKHIDEKKEVRKIKDECKRIAMQDKEIRCASFDLQQVIYLPKSNEGSIFYKRRLSNFNFTVYDITTKDCFCFLWNEAISKRGACEVCTALKMFLTNYDENNVKCVYLFSDSCTGQNKNSMVAAMLLHVINNSRHLKEIQLRFFCPSHGQSEGDSAHSAIAHSISKAGDIFVPSQLEPIIRLARRNKPYIVNALNEFDFLNFRYLSTALKLLSIRTDDQNGDDVNWLNMVEFRVVKENPTVLYFKNSHLEKDYRSITIKRQRVNALKQDIPHLHASRNESKLPKAKYDDLMKLCSGPTPIIRSSEHINYYKSLPHM